MYDYFKDAHKDYLRILTPVIKAGGAVLQPNGKILIVTRPAYDTPWIHAKIMADRSCNIYHSLYFGYFKIIHPICLNCWKIIARPGTLRQLVQVLEYQRESGRFAKSGIERRQTVCGQYGAYWYTNSVEEGLSLRDKLRKDLKSIGNFADDIILKRGCTEFEHAMGPSEKWEISDKQRKVQEELDRVLYSDVKEQYYQPESVVLSTFRKWVSFAYDRGDKTYLDFTGNRPLYPHYTTYEGDAEDAGGCQTF